MHNSSNRLSLIDLLVCLSVRLFIPDTNTLACGRVVWILGIKKIIFQSWQTDFSNFLHQSPIVRVHPLFMFVFFCIFVVDFLLFSEQYSSLEAFIVIVVFVYYLFFITQSFFFHNSVGEGGSLKDWRCRRWHLSSSFDGAGRREELCGRRRLIGLWHKDRRKSEGKNWSTSASVGSQRKYDCLATPHNKNTFEEWSIFLKDKWKRITARRQTGPTRPKDQEVTGFIRRVFIFQCGDWTMGISTSGQQWREGRR